MSLSMEPVEQYTGEVWYRVEDHRTTRGPSVFVMKIPVLRHTPKGVWLNHYGYERFVLKNARKRWACPTEEEAWESFYARKLRQRVILRDQLKHVEAVLKWNEEAAVARA